MTRVSESIEFEDVVTDGCVSTSTALAATPNREQLRELSHKRMGELFRIRTSEEIEQLLTHRGVPDDEELKTAAKAVQLDAMAEFNQSYIADEKLVEFAESVVAKVRHIMVRRDFDDPVYREFWYDIQKVLQGKRLPPLPEAMKSLRDAFFIVEGPSLCGKTAFLSRLSRIIGGAFHFYGIGKQPAFINVIPCVSIAYPECNTKLGLLRRIRYAIVAQAGGVNTPAGVFPEVEGDNGLDALISMCIITNVVALFVDGACFHRLSNDARQILEVLVRLQRGAGIAVLLSGTPAFLQPMNLAGSVASNLFGGKVLSLNPLESPVDGAGNLNPESRFFKYVVTLWAFGVLSTDTVMPPELPNWLHLLTVGRIGWLVEVFEELHIAFIKDPTFPAKLTYEKVEEIARKRLGLRLSTRYIAMEYLGTGEIKDDADFYNYADQFPKSLFQKKKYMKLLRAGV